MGSTPDKPTEVLLFVHIAKTAGTTVRSVIRMEEPGQGNRKAGANTFRGSGGLNPKTVEKLRDGARYLDLDRVRILHGHQPFGIGGYLERSFPERALRYLTFVREPVDRALSHYFEVLRNRALPEDMDPEEAE